MIEVEIDQHFSAPPQKVFEAVTDHKRIAEWQRGTRVSIEKPGVPAPNGLGAVRMRGYCAASLSRMHAGASPALLARREAPWDGSARRRTRLAAAMISALRNGSPNPSATSLHCSNVLGSNPPPPRPTSSPSSLSSNPTPSLVPTGIGERIRVAASGRTLRNFHSACEPTGPFNRFSCENR